MILGAEEEKIRVVVIEELENSFTDILNWTALA